MLFYEFVLGFLAVCIIFVVARVLVGPSIWDRLLGFNMISMKIVISIVLLALVFDTSFYLDIALAYVILGFIGTILVARYIEKGGDK